MRKPTAFNTCVSTLQAAFRAAADKDTGAAQEIFRARGTVANVRLSAAARLKGAEKKTAAVQAIVDEELQKLDRDIRRRTKGNLPALRAFIELEKTVLIAVRKYEGNATAAALQEARSVMLVENPDPRLAETIDRLSLPRPRAAPSERN